jgi:hypothetical protein
VQCHKSVILFLQALGKDQPKEEFVSVQSLCRLGQFPISVYRALARHVLLGNKGAQSGVCLKTIMSTAPVHWMHWDLREAWLVLTLTAKFYILCLFLGAVYVSYLLAQTTFDMRGFLTDKAAGRAPGVRSRLFEMDGRIENLRQFNTMLLILFGIFFANETFSTLRAVQLSALSLSAARIDSFEPLTLFAFFVLVILAFLHGFQWIVAARLRSSRASLWLQEQQLDG